MARKRTTKPDAPTTLPADTTLSIDGREIPKGQEEQAIAEVLFGKPEATDAESNGHAEVVETAPEPTTPGPEDDGGAARRMLLKIFESARVVRDKRRRFEDANDQAKRLKKSLETAQEEHENLEAELERQDTSPPGPLFALKPGPGAVSAAAVGDDDAWKAVPLESLGLAPGILKSLAEVKVDGEPITTLGRLAAFTSTPGVDLTSVPGIGEAKAEQIREATARYWAEHPRPAAEDKWREVKLSALQLDREVIRSLDGIQTVGEIADALEGDSIENLVGGNEGCAHALRIALQRFRRERGGAVLEGLPETRLEPEGGSDGDDEYGD
jgi:hypothetical protein